MNAGAVPERFKWMIPLVEELNDEANYLTGLSATNRAIFDARFTRDVRVALEDWIHGEDGNTGPEEQEFYMAMVELDEHGLLAGTEPVLDYSHWVGQLEVRFFAHRIRAAQMLGTSYAAELAPPDRQLLLSRVGELAEQETHPVTLIWFGWLRCLLGDNPEDDLNEWRRIVATQSYRYGGENRLLDDACKALVSVPQVTSNDVQLIEEVAFDSGYDEYSAAVLIERILTSPYTTTSDKQRCSLRAMSNPSEVIRDAASSAYADRP